MTGTVECSAISSSPAWAYVRQMIAETIRAIKRCGRYYRSFFPIGKSASIPVGSISKRDGGPIGSAALSVDHEHMVTRRLYAIEFWVAMGGLAIYLAITEIGPRLKRMRHGSAPPSM